MSHEKSYMMHKISCLPDKLPSRKTLKCHGHVRCTSKVVPNGAVPSTDSDLLTLVSLLHVNGLNRLVFGQEALYQMLVLSLSNYNASLAPYHYYTSDTWVMFTHRRP